MKVNATGSLNSRTVASAGVVIQLSQFEAGYLRHILLEVTAGEEGSFASDLFGELQKFCFPDYERKYSNWNIIAEEEEEEEEDED